MSSDNTKKSSSIFPWLLVIIIGSAFAWYVNKNNTDTVNTSQKVLPATANQEQNSQAAISNNDMVDKPLEVVSYHDAVTKAAQSVVNIYTTQKVKQHPYMEDPLIRQFFEFNGAMPQAPKNETNLGSGVIVSSDGYIVTNAHVVEKADEIIVAFHDGNKSKAKVIGSDSESDLAVIKVEGVDLKPLAFREKAIRVGDVALAIGNPFGVGQTVTQGIISATDRTGLGVNTFEDFIQTDAAINPGNSGGALVDAYGNLIGINTMIYSRSGGSMGIGFAIPTTIVKQVMNGLIENGKVSRGWLGIEVKSQIISPTNLNASVGVMVTKVLENGPAAASGLQIGDVITSINGKDMTDANALVQFIANKLPDTELIAEVVRGKDVLELSITLAERPSKQQLQESFFRENPIILDNNPTLPNNRNGEGSIDFNNRPNAGSNNGVSKDELTEQQKAALIKDLIELFQ